jgi:hypothetical protein
MHGHFDFGSLRLIVSGVGKWGRRAQLLDRS